MATRMRITGDIEEYDVTSEDWERTVENLRLRMRNAFVALQIMHYDPDTLECSEWATIAEYDGAVEQGAVEPSGARHVGLQHL